MLYFALWSIFLLVVLVSIPIVVFLEKRRSRAELPATEAQPSEDADLVDAEPALDEEPLDQSSVDGAPQPIDDFGDPGADADFGGDELAEFEEI